MGALIDAGVAHIAGMLGFDWHSLPPTLLGASAFDTRLFQLTFNENFSNLPDVRSYQCCAVLSPSGVQSLSPQPFALD